MNIRQDEGWKASKVEVVKMGDEQFNVVIDLFTSDNKTTLNCIGATDVYDLLEALDSDYVAVEETTDLQLEFGRFKLYFFNEGYYEVKFDDIRQSNI